MKAATTPPLTRTCLGCGVDLPIRTSPGRPRIYCSGVCRAAVQSIRGPLSSAPQTDRHRRVAHLNYGSTRALDPKETMELRRRRREGWKVEHLATAYGVCRRTVERYLATPDPVLISIGGWQAYFVIGHRDTPLQVSAWEPVEKAA